MGNLRIVVSSLWIGFIFVGIWNIPAVSTNPRRVEDFDLDMTRALMKKGRNACLGFGHSCLGGFGRKRSSSGALSYKDGSELENYPMVVAPSDVDLGEYMMEDTSNPFPYKDSRMISDKNKLFKFFAHLMNDRNNGEIIQSLPGNQRRAAARRRRK